MHRGPILHPHLVHLIYTHDAIACKDHSASFERPSLEELITNNRSSKPCSRDTFSRHIPGFRGNNGYSLKQLRLAASRITNEQNVHISPAHHFVVSNLSNAAKQLKKKGFLDLLIPIDGRRHGGDYLLISSWILCNVFYRRDILLSKLYLKEALLRRSHIIRLDKNVKSGELCSCSRENGHLLHDAADDHFRPWSGSSFAKRGYQIILDQDIDALWLLPSLEVLRGLLDHYSLRINQLILEHEELAFSSAAAFGRLPESGIELQDVDHIAAAWAFEF